MVTLNAQNVLEIITGTCLLGGGGGGSFEAGMDLYKSMTANGDLAIPMISVDEMDADGYACGVAGMGSPLKFKARGATVSKEIISAFEAIQRQGFFMNKKIKYVMPIEYGAQNSLFPLLLAQETGTPFVDADGTGRAVPALDTLLYGVHDVPTGPMSMTNHKGDVIMAYPNDVMDAPGLEVIGRYLCTAFDMVMGISGWASSKEEIQKCLVPGANSRAMTVGRAIINARENGLDYITEIKKVAECRELFRGKLVKMDAIAKGGWDYGRSNFEGVGDFAGKTCAIDILNECLVAYVDGKVAMTVPDIICNLNLDTGEPMANADMKEGQNVSVIAMPAAANWFTSPRGMSCWQRYFDIIEYKGQNVRY